MGSVGIIFYLCFFFLFSFSFLFSFLFPYSFTRLFLLFCSVTSLLAIFFLGTLVAAVNTWRWKKERRGRGIIHLANAGTGYKKDINRNCWGKEIS